MNWISFRIHKAGWPFILGFCFFGLVFLPSFSFFGKLLLALGAFCAYFFRDPKRIPPQRPDLVVSPADGIVTFAGDSTLPPEFDRLPAKRISIFLNVFDVHINRIPATGHIEKVHYHPGQFLNASLDKSSDLNERSSVLMRAGSRSDQSICFVQIAGLIARRIINTLTPNQDVTVGEQYGIIRFGSRMDIYVPLEAEVLVLVGQRMIGGETVLALLP